MLASVGVAAGVPLAFAMLFLVFRAGRSAGLVGGSLVGAVAVTAYLIGGRTVGTSSDSVTASFTMVQAVEYDADYYWAAAVGRVSNFQGAHISMGPDDYVWWTIDGNGHDPGLSVTDLAGDTGHVVALTDDDPPSTVAASTVTVVAGVAGWGGTNQDGITVNFVGPAAATVAATDWDARGNGTIAADMRNGLHGMHSHRWSVPDGGVEGPIAGIWVSQHTTSPGSTIRVVAMQVWVGTVFDSSAAERTHWALYSGTSTTTPITDSALVYDFGQDLTTFGTSGWETLWVDENTLVEITASTELWLAVYGSGTATVHGLYDNASAGQLGDWTDAALVQSSSVMPVDATTAAPSAQSGTTVAGFAGVFMARLIYEVSPFAARAEFHSTADPFIIGAHIDATDNVSNLTADAVLTQSVTLTDVGPYETVAVEMCVDAVHNASNQPRLFAYFGGDDSNLEIPEVDGATLLQDGGQLTGSVTDAWLPRAVVGSVPDGEQLVIGLTHGGPAGGTATSICFTALAAWDTDANLLDAPCDFNRPAIPASGVGPEIAFISDESTGFNVDDPTVAPPANIGTYSSELRPGNVGGSRARARAVGLVAL